MSSIDYDASPVALPTAASLFERFCEAALPDQLNGNAIHFGWPNRSGRPEAFAEATRWLATKLNVSLGDGYREPRRRDGGVDLVTWRSLQEGRSFDYRLVQCTIGLDILRKAREIDVDQWIRWIRFWERPQVTLAVPHQTAPTAVEVREAEALGTLVLDRLRLVELANSDTEAVDLITREILTSVGLAVDATE